MTIKWTEKLIVEMCGLLAEGKAIRDFAGKKGFPSAQSIYRRLAADEEFGTRIARAREHGRLHEEEECIRIADRATPFNYQVARLRIWARQWRMSKVAPKQYGDRTAVQQLGKDGQPVDPVQPVINLTLERPKGKPGG